MKQEILDTDIIINKLLEGQFLHPGTEIDISESQILKLVDAVVDIFMSQPVLLELEAPIKLCGILWSLCIIIGDVHGQFYDLLRLFQQNGLPPESKYLFLGFVLLFVIIVEIM